MGKIKWPQNEGDAVVPDGQEYVRVLWNLEAPEDFQIVLTVNEFDIGDEVDGECDLEYFEVRPHVGVPVSKNWILTQTPGKWLDGHDLFCGSALPINDTENGHRIYHTNELVFEYLGRQGVEHTGLDFDYRYVSVGGCSHAEGILLSNSDGYFMSPNFPDPYPQFTACKMHFTSDPSNSIHLSIFTIFESEEDDECTDDYVLVKDLVTDEEHKLCKQLTTHELQLSYNIEVQFITDEDEDVGPGFFAHYWHVPQSPTSPATTPTRPTMSTPEPGPCHPNPCLNGGICSVDGDGNRHCECVDHYIGEICQFAPCNVPDIGLIIHGETEYKPHPQECNYCECSNGQSICTEYVCVESCHQGSSDCADDADECLVHPCLNSNCTVTSEGVCVNPETSQITIPGSYERLCNLDALEQTESCAFFSLNLQQNNLPQDRPVYTSTFCLEIRAIPGILKYTSLGSSFIHCYWHSLARGVGADVRGEGSMRVEVSSQVIIESSQYVAQQIRGTMIQYLTGGSVENPVLQAVDAVDDEFEPDTTGSRIWTNELTGATAGAAVISLIAVILAVMLVVMSRKRRGGESRGDGDASSGDEDDDVEKRQMTSRYQAPSTRQDYTNRAFDSTADNNTHESTYEHVGDGGRQYGGISDAQMDGYSRGQLQQHQRLSQKEISAEVRRESERAYEEAKRHAPHYVQYNDDMTTSIRL